MFGSSRGEKERDGALYKPMLGEGEEEEGGEGYDLEYEEGPGSGSDDDECEIVFGEGGGGEDDEANGKAPRRHDCVQGQGQGQGQGHVGQKEDGGGTGGGRGSWVRVLPAIPPLGARRSRGGVDPTGADAAGAAGSEGDVEVGASHFSVEGGPVPPGRRRSKRGGVERGAPSSRSGSGGSSGSGSGEGDGSGGGAGGGNIVGGARGLLRSGSAQRLVDSVNSVAKNAGSAALDILDRHFAGSTAVRDFNEAMPVIVLPTSFVPKRGAVVLSSPEDRLKGIDNS